MLAAWWRVDLFCSSQWFFSVWWWALLVIFRHKNQKFLVRITRLLSVDKGDNSNKRCESDEKVFMTILNAVDRLLFSCQGNTEADKMLFGRCLIKIEDLEVPPSLDYSKLIYLITQIDLLSLKQRESWSDNATELSVGNATLAMCVEKECQPLSSMIC